MFEWLFILAAIGGTIFSAVLGWLSSGEVFIWRKFAYSILSAVLAGAITAFGFQTLDFTLWNLLFVFLSGAGVDVVLNRAAGAIQTKGYVAKTVEATA